MPKLRLACLSHQENFNNNNNYYKFNLKYFKKSWRTLDQIHGSVCVRHSVSGPQAGKRCQHTVEIEDSCRSTPSVTGERERESRWVLWSLSVLAASSATNVRAATDHQEPGKALSYVFVRRSGTAQCTPPPTYPSTPTPTPSPLQSLRPQKPACDTCKVLSEREGGHA